VDSAKTPADPVEQRFLFFTDFAFCNPALLQRAWFLHLTNFEFLGIERTCASAV
jgi:hypothetical protein